jgi:hypothetical protein
LIEENSMKTIELTGAALDWAVAKAADYLHRQGDHWMVALPYVSARMNFVPGPRCVFSPSTRWSQGGPIIEREKIVVDLAPHGWCCMMFEDENTVAEEYGPTPLVAAMRCYVASRLGEEVEVPDDMEN